MIEAVKEIAKTAKKTRLVGIVEAAEYVGITPQTLKRWLKRDKVPHRKHPYKFGVRLAYLDYYKKQIECEC